MLCSDYQWRADERRRLRIPIIVSNRATTAGSNQSSSALARAARMVALPKPIRAGHGDRLIGDRRARDGEAPQCAERHDRDKNPPSHPR